MILAAVLLAVAQPDDAWETLAKLRSNIESVEFLAGNEHGNAAEGDIQSAKPADPNLYRFHREGVYYKAYSSDKRTEPSFHEHSFNLNRPGRSRTTNWNRGSDGQSHLSNGHFTPDSNLHDPIRLWPQLRFQLSRRDSREPLVRVGPQKRNGVNAELFERRGSWWTTRYWLDMSKQGSLVECDELHHRKKTSVYRIHSIELATIPDGRGGVIWHPVRGVVDSLDDSGGVRHRAVLKLDVKSLKVNTGRTMHGTEIQFAAGDRVYDDRDKSPPGAAAPAAPVASSEPIDPLILRWLIGLSSGFAAALAFLAFCSFFGCVRTARFTARAIWTAVWAGWAWVGVGLYRELPRLFGPPIREIPIAQHAHDIGWIRDSNHVAVLPWKMPKDLQGIHVYNATTGERLRIMNAPYLGEFFGDRRSFARRGFQIANRAPNPKTGKEMEGLFRLDLQTGEWKQLTEKNAADAAVHADKPWVLVTERGWPIPRIERIAIIDVWTGAVLLEQRSTAEREIDDHPFFLTGSDRFAVATTSRERKSGMEVWSIANPPRMEKFIPDVHLGRNPTLDRSGRIVCRDWKNPSSLLVYDLNEERVVREFTRTDLGPLTKTHRDQSPPTLSPGGKTLFADEPYKLHNVETGEIVWRPSKFEDARFVVSNDAFAVHESWKEVWKDWFPNSEYETIAVRNLETGRLIHRVTGFTIAQDVNNTGTLAMEYDGKVFAYPPKVDWPLLAGCQTVLAAPMVLVWGVGRWRRKRAARRDAAV